MRVRDLKHVLEEVRGIFVSAGARQQDKAFAAVADALKPFDDDDVDDYLPKVRTAADDASAPLEDQYSRTLMESGLDEATFLAALDKLRGDKRMKKPTLQKVVKKYIGIVDKKATTSQLLDAIKLAFYKKLYERDARELARKATPV